MEWNENELIWRFDNQETNRISLTNLNTFLNGPVVVMFYLRVGGLGFGSNLAREDVVKWTCSALIIDYVRFYRWVEIKSSSDLSLDETVQDESSVDSCPIIMREIMSDLDENPSDGINLVTTMAVTILPILCILVPLIVWLFVRMKKLKKPKKVENDREYYDDIGHEEVYDKVEYEYNNYDQNIYYQDQNKDNYYSEPVIHKLTDEDEQGYAMIVINNNRNTYLQIDL